MLAPWKKSYDQPRQHIKKQRHFFTHKGPSSQSCGFSSSHIWVWELDYKESWVPKNWCFWTVVLEKMLEHPLDCKDIQPVNPKRNQPCIYIGRTDAEAETPIFWPSHAKNWLIGKDPDAGKDWRREEKKMTKDEMAGWHHRRDGHEFEKAPGIGDGQGSLVCCSPCGCRVGHDWATELNSPLVSSPTKYRGLGDPPSPFWRRSALGFLWREWCWSWNSSALATSCEELTHWKRLWCWEGLGAGGEGDDRGWDGWMASPTWWTWVSVNSGSWWWTGRPGVLWFMGLQRVRHDWATDLIWSDLIVSTSGLLWRLNNTFPVKYLAQFQVPRKYSKCLRYF